MLHQRLLLLSLILLHLWLVSYVSALPSPQFGRSIASEFLLNYTNFNHGSFGACPKRVLRYQNYLRTLQEQQPDIWMRSYYRSLLNDTRRELAASVSAQEDSIVLVESASTACNAILRSLEWSDGDVILYYSSAYGMVKHTVAYLTQTVGVRAYEVPVEFPITKGNATFLEPMHRALQEMKKAENSLRMVILDHIVSVPAVRLPVRALTLMIKSYYPDTFVLVDGAHALGQVPSLRIPASLGPIDAYFTNGHKWLYSPKGSALLWVNTTRVNSLFPEPTVVSSANDVSMDIPFTQRFVYVSTRDYTATLSMAKALEFRRETLGGDAAIYNYVRSLAIQAKHHLMGLWNVSAVAPDEMEDFMINLCLPVTSAEQGKLLQTWLLEKHNIYMLSLHHEPTNTFFTRISVQVYLEFSDFERLGNLVLEFIATMHDDFASVL